MIKIFHHYLFSVERNIVVIKYVNGKSSKLQAFGCHLYELSFPLMNVYYKPRAVTASLPLAILAIIPCRALPGPHSMNSVAPAAIMF